MQVDVVAILDLYIVRVNGAVSWQTIPLDYKHAERHA